ncbi:hypothetical protein ACYJFH_004873, partial [Salmonella enterica subsp. enterica serovar Kentucky]
RSIRKIDFTSLHYLKYYLMAAENILKKIMLQRVINVENDQEYFLSRNGNYHYCSLFELFLN